MLTGLSSEDDLTGTSATEDGPLKGKPTWSGALRRSTTSAFFVRRLALCATLAVGVYRLDCATTAHLSRPSPHFCQKSELLRPLISPGPAAICSLQFSARVATA